MVQSTENLVEAEEEASVYGPKVRWAIPQRLDFMTFVGRDVVAVAHDVYIIFFHLKNMTELVYVANNEKTGDGVDVIAGHGAPLRMSRGFRPYSTKLAKYGLVEFARL
ncbi:jg25007 [Pararge aegeria aegeria]|uniref:Jg25007 protein n=1 Tax=Pararge aegeria aegeria TaxID=348720 RepID=A0A8S4S808_9NEOP|nr:jg25007 [Pararge aegeria aegeria]